MNPYILLTASPYAMNAANADSLGGLSASQFGQLSNNQTWTGTNTFNPSNSTAAVQVVQNSTSAVVLDVDTANKRLGVGNGSPSYALDVTGDSNTSGSYRIAGSVALQEVGTGNVFVGGAGNGSVTGSSNVGLSAGALNSLAGGNYNFALGGNSLYGNTSGNSNIAIGITALQDNDTGNGNVAIGQNVGAHMAGSGSTNNTLIGYNVAGQTSLTSGGNNTIIGGNSASLAGITSADNNIIIGANNFYNTGSVTSLSGDLVIANNVGTGLTGASSNYMDIGNTLYGDTSNGTAYFQPQSDSASAFQINNAESGTIFAVDSNPLSGVSGTSTWSSASGSGLLPAAIYGTASATSNGYIYSLGGFTTSTTNAIYYAHPASDGSVTSWTTNVINTPDTEDYAGAVAYNGYMYYLGGVSSGTRTNAVAYATISNTNGSVGAWTTSTNTLPQLMDGMSVTAYNGYIYVIGGYAGSSQNTVYYAQLNSSTGAVGAWTTSTNTLPAGVSGAAAVVNNGYVYIIGGDNTSSLPVNTVFYAQLNGSTGAVGAWSTATTTLPTAIYQEGAVVTGNDLIAYGGIGPLGAFQSAVEYAPINGNGSVGTWTTATNAMPAASNAGGYALDNNGYMYYYGGTNGTGTINSVMYAQPTTSISYQGTLTATANLKVHGPALFQDNSSSTSAFQVQDASGNNVIAADTLNGYLTIGSGSTGEANPLLIILDNGTTAADPTTEVNGALYYNASKGSLRCGVAGVWEDCIGGLLTSATSSTSVHTCTTACAALATYTIPANYCVQGRVITINASGSVSTTSTPKMQFQVLLGATVLGRSAAVTPTSALSNNFWRVDLTIVCDSAVGASTTITSEGTITIDSTGATITSANVLPLGNVAQGTITYTGQTGSFSGIATNGSLTLTLVPYFGTSSASNSFTIQQFNVTGS
jgi:hypothetical protein